MSDTPIARVISVYNEKGGSGKTTTACQLAGTLGRRGFSVLVADLDPQETSSSWASKHGGEYFYAHCWAGHRYGEKVATQLAQRERDYDVIIADCAPSVEIPATWGALLSSHLALIPTKLNPQDMDALPAAKKLAKRAWDTGGAFPIRVVANAVKARLNDDQAALRALARDTEIPALATTLGDRKAFSRSMHYGSSVHAVPKSDDSVAEMENLANEVLKLIGLPTKKGGRK